MSQFKRVFILSNLCLLSLLVFLCTGCASSELVRFEKNTRTMSDTELLNCYYGLNARIKDIDRSIKSENRPNHAQNRDVTAPQTFILGGAAHSLMQKEKIALKELQQRNITP